MDRYGPPESVTIVAAPVPRTGRRKGHLAVVVDDLDAEHARLEAAGRAPRKLVDFQNDGVRIARFFFIADPDGYQIEVIEKGGRFR